MGSRSSGYSIIVLGGCQVNPWVSCYQSPSVCGLLRRTACRDAISKRSFCIEALDPYAFIILKQNAFSLASPAQTLSTFSSRWSCLAPEALGCDVHCISASSRLPAWSHENKEWDQWKTDGPLHHQDFSLFLASPSHAVLFLRAQESSGWWRSRARDLQIVGILLFWGE